MLNVKLIKYGLVLATAIISNNVSADALNGKYICVQKAMDIDYKMEFGANNQYILELELFDIVGIEKGNYSINEKTISFTPAENTRSGKKQKTKQPYKRNLISNAGNSLIMTNINDNDKINCNK